MSEMRCVVTIFTRIKVANYSPTYRAADISIAGESYNAIPPKPEPIPICEFYLKCYEVSQMP